MDRATPTNLDMDLVRAFVTVVDTQNFTRAAEYLGRSQPAISLQIQRLEAQLRAPLLQRQSRTVSLTTEGAALLPRARQLLRLNDEIMTTWEDGQLEGEVRFGAPEDIASLHLPDILARFARSHPRIHLAVTCDYSANLLDLMSRGRLDLVLFKREPLGPDIGVSVWREPLVWVARDPGLVEREALSLVLAPAPDVYRRRAITALQSEKRAFRASFTSPSLAGQLAALRAGLGIGVLPAAMVPKDLGVVSEHLPRLDETEIALVTAKGAASGPASLLAQEVMQAFGHRTA